MKSAVAAVLTTFSFASVGHAASIVTIQNGNYFVGATWAGGSVPVTSDGTDTATIDAAHAVTASGNVLIATVPNSISSLTVNGFLDLANNEIHIGFDGFADKIFTATLTIGSSGVVQGGKIWMDGAWGNFNGNPKIDFTGAGGVLSVNGFGLRVFDTFVPGPITWTGNPAGNQVETFSNTMFEYLWDNGFLTHNGANAGAFADNFTVSGNTLTAIPETSVVLLGIMGLFPLLRRHRA